MSGRDDWARLTPYEVGIPGREFVERVFPAIGEEAETRGVDPTDPGAFIQLGEVGRALRQIQGEERGGEAIHRFGALLFHAFHFHRAGEPLLLLTTEVARHLVRGGTALEGWDGSLPSVAGYLQLPRHLFWSHPEEESPAEALDGIFWTHASGDTLALLVVLGVRADRPGVSVMELPPLPLEDAPKWVSAPVREGEEDFTTTLPGGELDELYSVVTMGEALKLVGRALAYLTAVPESLGAEERAPRPETLEGEAAHPRPSLLPFRRVRLAGGSAPLPGSGGEG